MIDLDAKIRSLVERNIPTAFVGIFCGFARAYLERNHDLRNQQVAIRDTMLGAEPRNLLICPHVVSDQDVKTRCSGGFR